MRNTEGTLLTKLDSGKQLSQHDVNKLSTKLGKGQSKGRARDITQGTENAYQTRLGQLNDQEKQSVANAVRDYTADSSTINTDCRQGKSTTTITRIDAALNTLQGNGTQPHRVTYRLMSYKNNTPIPYGATTGDAIKVGDYVRDKAYVSASENRQFLVNGIKNPPPGTRYVKMAIYGRGGVNISGGSQYTNDNETAFLKMNNPKTYRFRTADAGQAEILYERGTVFRVDQISPSGNDVHVVVSIPTNPPGGGIKDSYSGQPSV